MSDEGIIWNEKYSVKNSTIDEQHKYILELLNELYLAVKDESSIPIEKIMFNLRIYTETHFQYEESFLRVTDFSDLVKHKKLHQVMRDKTIEYEIKTKNKSEEITFDLFKFIKDWWINHIRKEDLSYAPYMKKLEL